MQIWKSMKYNLINRFLSFVHFMIKFPLSLWWIMSSIQDLQDGTHVGLSPDHDPCALHVRFLVPISV